MKAQLVYDPMAGPEAAHFIAALSNWMKGRGWSVAVDYPRGEALESFFGPSRRDAGSDVRVLFAAGALAGGRVRVTFSGGSKELPFAISPSTFGCTAVKPLETPRVLIYGDANLARRLRMSMKVIGELRRRRWRFTAVCAGELSEEFIRPASPDEIHSSLSPEELANLFCSSSAVLETSDQQEMLTPAFYIATTLGLPVVCHRDAVAAGATNCITVDEWSADAFCDAMMSAGLRVERPRDESRLQQSLELFEKVLIGAA